MSLHEPGARERDVRRVVISAAVIASVLACPAPECEDKLDLVDMTAWELLAPNDDPFVPPADAPLCTDDNILMQPFGSGESTALDVETRAGCGWATLAQASAADLVAGDVLFSRLFYFSQTAFPSAEADVALRFGDDDMWRLTVPIPAPSKLEFPSITIAHDVPAGTTVLFHIGNHGSNSWNLLEVSRVRRVSCPSSTLSQEVP
jgi:hypothetical protein